MTGPGGLVQKAASNPPAARSADGAVRLAWIDIAKAISILLVVTMHSTLGVEKAVGETGWMGPVVAFAQPFRIPAFFAISGLFLSRTLEADRRTFLDRRVVHFVYFYLLWLTIQFAFKAPGMAAENGVAHTFGAYLTAVFVEPFGTLWFIWMLPVFALAVRATRRVPWPLILALAAALEIAPIATGTLVIDEFSARFVFFYAGHALSLHVRRLADTAARWPAAALTALLFWSIAQGAAVFSGASGEPGLSLLLGALGTMATVTAAALIYRLPALALPLAVVGEKSIVIYLAFFLPMAAMRTLLVETRLLPDVGTMSLVTTVFAVLVPLALWWVCLRTGMTFLFERPRWARLKGASKEPAGSRTPHPAE